MKKLWKVLLLTGLLTVALAAGASAVSWVDYVEVDDPLSQVEEYGDPFEIAAWSYDKSKYYLSSETYRGEEGWWTTYYYGADGAMTAYEDADGKQTVSELYRFKTQTNADGTAWIEAYETATGELHARQDFDAQGRLVRESYMDGWSHAYTYDASGRVVKLSDSEGFTTTYTYDASGRVSSVTYDDGTDAYTQTYTYDSPGHLIRVMEDGELWMTVRYGDDGRLSSYTYGDDLLTVSYQYSGDLLAKRTHSDGSSVVYTYDAEGKLVKAVTDYTGEEGYSYTQTFTYAAVAPASTTGFRDVAANAWYAPYVQSMVDKGFMKGQSSDVFAPNANMTVAEAITLAVRMAAGEGQSFTQGTPWYQVYVDWAKANGLPWDYADYNAKITRTEFAQLFAAVYRSSEAMQKAVQPMNTVPDGSIPDVAMTDANAADVYLLYRLGVLAGSDAAHSFKPGSDILRSEVAAIACRLLDEGRQSFTME